MLESVTLALYSLTLACVLALGSPYWLWRMARGGVGWSGALLARLGRVPRGLRCAVAGRQVVWLHAVSVGEVLAAERLVAELEAALGEGWRIVISTTTATGQALARQRFTDGKDGDAATAEGRVFYCPLDFAWAVRAYLRVLQPKMLVLMESELWPRMLVECGRAGVPVAVVNARVSDRSFRRGMRVRAIWRLLLRKVNRFLAQSEEDARRLVVLGARRESVSALGNLKYDAAEPRESEIVRRLDAMRAGRRVIVAGSTLEGEEQMVLAAWAELRRGAPELVLVIAPRHPPRFAPVRELIMARGFTVVLASHLPAMPGELPEGAVVLLDTVGDLAVMYRLAEIAFVGGSLVPRGGHNPLESARFGVPVVMGPSYENFRDIVGAMRAASGICIVRDGAELRDALIQILTDREGSRAMGARARAVFEQQQGATAKTVAALLALARQSGGKVPAENHQ